MPIVAEGAGILSDVTSFISSAVSWMTSFLTEITNDSSKILVTFVVCVPLVGLGISLLQRLISTRG